MLENIYTLHVDCVDILHVRVTVAVSKILSINTVTGVSTQEPLYNNDKTRVFPFINGVDNVLFLLYLFSPLFSQSPQ